jgi:hypothetical protein
LSLLHESVFKDEPIYHAEIDPSHERISEIFVRANSGGEELSKSDLLPSTNDALGDLEMHAKKSILPLKN